MSFFIGLVVGAVAGGAVVYIYKAYIASKVAAVASKL